VDQRAKFLLLEADNKLGQVLECGSAASGTSTADGYFADDNLWRARQIVREALYRGWKVTPSTHNLPGIGFVTRDESMERLSANMPYAEIPGRRHQLP
jgi:hypothetical protein